MIKTGLVFPFKFMSVDFLIFALYTDRVSEPSSYMWYGGFFRLVSSRWVGRKARWRRWRPTHLEQSYFWKGCSRVLLTLLIRSGLQFLLSKKERKKQAIFFHSILFLDVAPELGLIKWKDHELLSLFIYLLRNARSPQYNIFFCSIKTVEQWHSVVLCCYQEAFKYCWVLQNPTPDLVAFTSKNCLNSSYCDLLYVPKASCPFPPSYKGGKKPGGWLSLQTKSAIINSILKSFIIKKTTSHQGIKQWGII